MKKFFSVLICLLILFCFAVPTFADGPKITFTADSLPEVGGKLTVDKSALMNDEGITAEMYNALLDGNVICTWFKNGIVSQEGIGEDSLSYELLLSDQGCTFYAKVSFYEDDRFLESQKLGEVFSGEITVTSPAPEILTHALENATIGTPYRVLLKCNDPDAVFSEFMGSQLAEFGLYLTQHGEIEGTPIKAGNCHINILVVSEGGGENSVSFDLTVHSAASGVQSTPPPSSTPIVSDQPSTSTPAASDQPSTSTPADSNTPSSNASNTDHSGNIDQDRDFPWWSYAIIAVGGIGVGIGITYVFTTLKKKV